jgi:hypothetical protein
MRREWPKDYYFKLPTGEVPRPESAYGMPELNPDWRRAGVHRNITLSVCVCFCNQRRTDMGRQRLYDSRQLGRSFSDARTTCTLSARSWRYSGHTSCSLSNAR